VLVVDDSVVHRQTISELLKGVDDVEIVGKAANGEEALRMAALVNPDLITLDLEMPRMDGFTFLRILMSKQPIPVIVISSQSQRENVFKALELGALDFVARPVGGPAELATVRNELLAKVQVVRSLRPVARPPVTKPTTGHFPALSNRAATAVLAPRTPSSPTNTAVTPPTRTSGAALRPAPKRLVVVASSTGGPQAVVDLVGRLPANTNFAVVIAQHMPERFTRTFAERLARRSPLRVTEGEDGAWVEAGTIWICPGGRTTELELDPTGVPRLKVTAHDPADRYTPSADRLFRSAAATYGGRITAVVLTGMGDDGALSLPAIKRAGGEIWVEAPESAIVDGMPAAARKTGLADSVLPLPTLIARLAALQA
jgi:two-component system chemotaxis response regulator CheB